jgi:hypothetical protein
VTVITCRDERVKPDHNFSDSSPQNAMALKRKGSTISKDEERVSKRLLRSGRTIETSTAPLRLAKVVNPSTPSKPRVKPLTSTKSAMKIARFVDNQDELDQNNDEILLTPLQLPQTASVVRSKRALSNETNMDWTSVDTGSGEKKGLQSEALDGKTSTPKTRSARRTARGVVTPSRSLLPN